MREEDIRRLAGIAGGALFILALPLLLLRFGPGTALLGALVAGVACGVVLYLGGAIISAAREPAPAIPPPAAEPAKAEPGPDETRLFGEGDIPGGPALDQTVRIEPGSLDYVLPELSPEQILKEREGLDMDVIQQGIEGSLKARENLMKGDEQKGVTG